MKNAVKSLLRYPGGKSRKRVRDIIFAHAPKTYDEYREPFLGGGGIGLAIDTSKSRWFNDVNSDLMMVYKRLQNDAPAFIEECREIKILPSVSSPDYAQKRAELKVFFDACVRKDPTIDQAVGYLFQDRVSFSGRVVDGHTNFAAPERWNIITSDVPEKVSAQLQGATLSCVDFESVLLAAGDNVWIYCDPPYMSDTLRSPGARLYNHTFSLDDHVLLADAIAKCPHQVTLSYDDHPTIRELYQNYWIHETSWTHSVSSTRTAGKELIITNFPVEIVGNNIFYTAKAA
jgi:DNA adenine methylase